MRKLKLKQTYYSKFHKTSVIRSGSPFPTSSVDDHLDPLTLLPTNGHEMPTDGTSARRLRPFQAVSGAFCPLPPPLGCAAGKGSFPQVLLTWSARHLSREAPTFGFQPLANTQRDRTPGAHTPFSPLSHRSLAFRRIVPHWLQDRYTLDFLGFPSWLRDSFSEDLFLYLCTPSARDARSKT